MLLNIDDIKLCNSWCSYTFEAITRMM